MKKILLLIMACLSLYGCVWNKIYIQNCDDVTILMPASTSANIPVTSTANVPVSGGAAQTGDTTSNVAK